MMLLRSIRMRSLFFGIVAFLILMLGTGSAAQDNEYGPIEASVPVVYASPASNNRLASPDSCLPDGNEPNDNPSQATVIGSSPLQASFHSVMDIDWYSFSSAGGTWRTAIASRSSIPLGVRVFSVSTGELVAEGVPQYEWWTASYSTWAKWFAVPSANYLIEIRFPTSASSLHTCTTSQYQFAIQQGSSVPSVGQYQLNGLVYHDSNWSDDWQIDEPPIEGVTVRLLRPGGAVVATQITDGAGVFHFVDVAPGQYVLEQMDLSGYISTTSNRVVVSLFQDTLVYFGDYYLPTRGSLQFLPLQLRQ